MTCALPAGLDIGLSQRPRTGTASRPNRSAQPQDAVEPESFGKILDNKRSLQTGSEPRTPEAAQVSPPESEALWKTREKEEAEWAPCAGTPAQSVELPVEWSKFAGSDPVDKVLEATGSGPPPAEPACPLEISVGVPTSLPDRDEQLAESVESRPAETVQPAPPETPAFALQAEPVRTALAAEAVRQPSEREGLRALESPEPPTVRQPLSDATESTSVKEVAPAIEGILKPSRLDFHFQTPSDAAPATEAKSDGKSQPQSVRRTVGEIHAMVRPETADSATIRFSELPNPISVPSAARPEQTAPDVSRTPQQASLVETAGLRSMTRVEELLQPASAAPSPLRSLNIQVEQGGRPVAVVHLEQQTAGLQVAVRSHAPAISEALRTELPQLVRSLQQGGIQSDFGTRAVASGESASAASSMHSGLNERGGEHGEAPRNGTSNWHQHERRQDRNDWREPVHEEDE